MRFLFLTLLVIANAHAREGFTLLAPADSGVAFTNLLSEQRHLTNQILLNGSGLAAGDIDGDGLCDLYFCRLDGANALYRNRGNWRFEEVAKDSGVALEGQMSTGSALADLDGDGDLDLIVNSFGRGTHVFFNNGKGKFTPFAKTLNPGKGGMSVSVGDLDGDGYLDLYIANYRTLGLMDIPNATANFKRADGKVVIESFNGRPMTDPSLTNRFTVGPRGGLEEHGEPDVIYRNIGGTNFTPLPWTGGDFLDEEGKPLRSELFDWGLAATIRDIDGDGLADIYVCNDFQTPDRLWINQGKGKFRLIKETALRKSSTFSMAVDFADLNRDGYDDFFVADMLSRSHGQRMREMLDLPTESISRPQCSINTLFLNRGDSSFAEIARFSGVHASEWSWSCVFVDVDLDGYEDLLISNGMERAARDLDMAAKLKALRTGRKLTDTEIFQARRGFPRLATANLAFRNQGDLTFEEKGAAWGFNLAGVSHGMALADLDNDGDLDVVLNNLNAPAALYRNEADAPRLAVRLKGAAPNSRGLGAKITVRNGAVPVQSQTMIGGGRYLSSDDPVRTFARGSGSNLTIEVAWPSGRRTEVTAASSSVQIIEEPAADPPAPRLQPAQAPRLFEELAGKVSFNHEDADFDDYARQPLLPKKLSHAGPGVAWYDFDGDGWEDLAIGNGRGGRIGIFKNNRKGGFDPLDLPALKKPLPRDTSAILGWRGAPGRGFLLSGIANYEDGQAVGGALTQIDLSGNSSGDVIPAGESSGGPVALADIDGDGDLDLFVGGSVVPGKYPAAATSRIFRNEGGRLVLDATNQAVLAEIGLVNSAMFTDIDGDRNLDLILTTEWGSIRVLRNQAGKFTDLSQALGLHPLKGWWTGLAAGDFDGDGRMDFVAGNWGLNTFPKPDREHPLKLFHGDFDQDGSYDIFESYFDPATEAYVPARQLSVLSKSLGFVRQEFSSNIDFSAASVEKVLGTRFATAKVLEANWLASTAFLNRGGRFEARPLPAEAQFAPVSGICAADFDGDGFDDIALAQNFFRSQPEIPRQDAGCGLILRGSGKGDFAPIPGQESGIAVYGEQRGMAAGDFDRDGRVDLVIAENSGPVHLFRNASATPQLRVSFEGSAANPDAIGASVRFRAGSRISPRREVQSSSGWLSQNSLVQLFASGGAGQIEVRWPDGLEEAIEIPPGVKQVRLKRNAEKK